MKPPIETQNLSKAQALGALPAVAALRLDDFCAARHECEHA